jgi:transcriptional regulator with XRE-family HTH domain
MYLKSGRLKSRQLARLLAHESGIDRTHVSSIERAKRGVSIDIVGRIAKALAVEPWKLLKDG